MKIEDKREKREKSPLIPMSDLEKGEVFKSYGGIYIKTEEYRCGVFTCIDLSNGDMCSLAREMEVTPVNAKVVIEE